MEQRQMRAKEKPLGRHVLEQLGHAADALQCSDLKVDLACFDQIADRIGRSMRRMFPLKISLLASSGMSAP